MRGRREEERRGEEKIDRGTRGVKERREEKRRGGEVESSWFCRTADCDFHPALP